MTTSERMAILRALESSPQIKAQYPQFWRVKRLEGHALRNLARSVGVNVEAISTEVARAHAPKPPPPPQEPKAAFYGTLQFPLRIELLGVGVTRQARVRWAYTPEWDYYAPAAARVVRGAGESYVLTAEFKVVPSDVDDLVELPDGRMKRLGTTEWRRLDLLPFGLLPEPLIERMFEMIDEEARRRDRKRREAVGVK
jgi:hypothetical protein